MRHSPTPAELLALKTGNAALLNSPDAACDIVATIVFALGSAQLLQSPEAAAEVERLRVMYDASSQREHDLIEERDRLSVRVAELEAARSSFLSPWIDRLDAKSLDNFLNDLCRAADYEPTSGVADEIEQTVAQWRILADEQCDHPNGHGPYGCAGCGAFAPADDDPLPEALHASSGAVIETASAAEDVSPQVQKLRDLIGRQRAAAEDPHDSPLHHTYAVCRDLPEVRP